MDGKPKIFAELERIALLIPAPYYWSDKDFVVVGVNEQCLDLLHIESVQSVIGKSAYELYAPESAAIVVEHSRMVVEAGKTLTFEEKLDDFETRRTRYYISKRSPLFEDGKVVGVVGVVTDITAQKEAEYLQIETIKMENELQKAKLLAQEKEKTQKIIAQVVHDIQSPEAVLSILVNYCTGMTEEKAFEALEKIAPSIPVPLYWLDSHNVISGGNELIIKAIGEKSLADFIGKTPYDYYPNDIADSIIKSNESIIKSDKITSHEEPIKDVSTGRIKYFSAFKAPLYDNNGNSIGTVGTSIDITAEKEAERLKIENERQKTKIEEQLKFKKLVDQTAQDTKSNLAVLLVIAQQCMGLTKKEVFATIEKVAVSVPISLYWFDENDALLGANKRDVELVGVTSATSYIGKTPYDIFPFEIADKVVKHNHLVMRTGKILSQEETIKDITTGEIKYCLAFKTPLYSNDGKNIGILCTSVDITAEKNAERLKLENERQKNELEQAEKIRKITRQVVHDIGSPIQSLRVMVENVKNIDEFNRVVIRNSTNRINDIMNNLTAKYGASGEIVDESPNVVAPEIISCLVDGILSEKRTQFADYDITFELHIANDAQGLFAKVNSERFKRIMSNVINNAVEAIAKKQQKHGCINIHVYQDGKLLCIQIKDNGCGIPKSILEKIGVDQISTKTKGDHGLGLSSAAMQLKEWGGSYNIDSVEDVGVTFTIGLPIAPVPDWFLDKINFMPHAQIVILDDDESIHNVWEMRFKEHLDKVTLHHFNSPTMLLKCLANLQTYDNILYLIDYELIGSKDSGIDVIGKLSTTKNAFLVTSRYEDQNVREECEKLKVRILPKNFAPYIPIQVANKNSSSIDFVIIDDQECITMMWQAMANNRCVKLAAFNSTKDFENIKDKLDKTTPIYIDRNLEPEDGLEYSKKLAAEGFTDIYLATADSKKTITTPTPWLKGIVDKRPPFI